jgi:hypothetical protein
MPEGAGRNYVRFDRGSGQRIAAAVLQVERGNRDQPGITTSPALGSTAPKVIRMGTFTGAWNTSTSHMVTFQTTTSTPNTVMAYNEFVNLPAAAGTAKTNVAIGKDGTAWYLMSWPDQGGPIKKGTFTGPWNKGATNSVSSGGTTYTVTNIGVPIGTTVSGQNCLFTQIGSEYQLVYADTAQIIRGTFDAPWVKNTTASVTASDGQTYTAYNPYGTAFRDGTLPDSSRDIRQCAIAYIGSQWEVVDAECLA